jgi:glycosyltransferase involved in cell wall biosynthesis
MLTRPANVERIVVLNDATKARGGATGLALLSIRRLRERGYAVTYIVGDDGSSDELMALGVEIVSVGGRALLAERKLTAATRGIYNTVAHEVVSTWVRKNDTPSTAYHVHGWSKILSPSIFDALEPVAARTVTHAHDYFLACPNGAYMDYVRDKPCTLVPLHASCLCTNCDKRSYPQKLWRSARAVALMRARASSSVWGPTLMIHRGMKPALMRAGMRDAQLMTMPNPAQSFRAARVEAENNQVFCFIGRVEREKGIEDAIAASSRAGVRLRVIGDGPLREALAREHPEVEFAGWQDRSSFADLVHDVRCVLVPSRYPEPFGLVIAEASLSGLPVIVSDTALLSDDVVDGRVGLSCNTRDLEAFTANIIRMRDMPSAEIRELSLQGHSGAARLAATETEWIDALVDVYQARVGAHR